MKCTPDTKIMCVFSLLLLIGATVVSFCTWVVVVDINQSNEPQGLGHLVFVIAVVTLLLILVVFLLIRKCIEMYRNRLTEKTYIINQSGLEYTQGNSEYPQYAYSHMTSYSNV